MSKLIIKFTRSLPQNLFCATRDSTSSVVPVPFLCTVQGSQHVPFLSVYVQFSRENITTQKVL